MNKRKKAILLGMILGDAFLQKTGKKNARIRLEHSAKQKDYILWKGSQFPEFFQGKPKRITRFNPIFKKKYTYFRWQSNSSPEIGKYRQKFYRNGKKIIPQELPKLFKESLSLAVWYMDDGYFYRRDKMAYIYLSKFSQKEIEILLKTLKDNFALEAKVKKKKRGNLVLIFNTQETQRLIDLIKDFIIPSMRYKISSLDPLSTAT